MEFIVLCSMFVAIECIAGPLEPDVVVISRPGSRADVEFRSRPSVLSMPSLFMELELIVLPGVADMTIGLYTGGGAVGGGKGGPLDGTEADGGTG